MGLRAMGYGFFSKLADRSPPISDYQSRVCPHPAAPEKRLTKLTVLTAAVMARTPSFRAKSPDQLRFDVRDLFREGLSHSPRGRARWMRDFHGHFWGGQKEGIKEKKRVFPPLLAKRGKLYTSGNAIPCQMTQVPALLIGSYSHVRTDPSTCS